MGVGWDEWGSSLVGGEEEGKSEFFFQIWVKN